MGVEEKLNYLLVMPRIVQESGGSYNFPLGICYVSSSLRVAGFNVFTVNLNHCDGDVFDILNTKITENRINVVATGGLSAQFSVIKRVIDAAKQADSRIITVVGGGIINGDPNAAMEALESADYGVIGEGEITMCELAHALESKTDIHEVNGLILGNDGSYHRTAMRKQIDDLDALPWPDYDGFDMRLYLEGNPPETIGLAKRRTLFMLGSRSCPYNCTFCFHPLGNKYRQRSLDSIFAELDHWTKHYNIDYLYMVDELFARKKERVREFCKRIKSYDIKWWGQFRADDVDEELTEILKNGNCAIMGIGSESADNRILKSMRKGITVEQIEKAFKFISDARIPFQSTFIFGDIEETMETAKSTLDWWMHHSEYLVALNVISVFPGSVLYEYACQHGIIKDRVQFLRLGCQQVNVSKIAENEWPSLMHSILETPYLHGKQLKDTKILSVKSRTGGLRVSGVCVRCLGSNTWENYRVFAPQNFVFCSHCGQKFMIAPSPELRCCVDRNVEQLLQQFNKLAVYGATSCMLDLFNHSQALQNANVFIVDEFPSKQNMEFNGKTVRSPSVIDEEQISLLLAATPNVAAKLSASTPHVSVQKVLNISNLLGDLAS